MSNNSIKETVIFITNETKNSNDIPCWKRIDLADTEINYKNKTEVHFMTPEESREMRIRIEENKRATARKNLWYNRILIYVIEKVCYLNYLFNEYIYKYF